MTKQECKYIKSCPMFAKLLLDSAKQVFIKNFCKGNFTECARYKMRQAGNIVPDNLLPTGTMLPEIE